MFSTPIVGKKCLYQQQFTQKYEVHRMHPFWSTINAMHMHIKSSYTEIYNTFIGFRLYYINITPNKKKCGNLPLKIIQLYNKLKSLVNRELKQSKEPVNILHTI